MVATPGPPPEALDWALLQPVLGRQLLAPPVVPLPFHREEPADRHPCVVHNADTGQQLAGGSSSWCPELESLDHAAPSLA